MEVCVWCGCQVEELKARVAADEVQRVLMWRFVDAVKKAVGKPLAQKPGPDSWQQDEVSWPRLEAIREYALELPDGNKALAEQVRRMQERSGA